MNEKLLDLLIDYSKRGEYVDLKFADEVAKIFYESHDIIIPLPEFELSSDKKTQNILGKLSIVNQKILLNVPVLYTYIESELQQYSHLLSTSFDRTLFYNIYLCKTILHELEHIRQYSLVASDIHILRYSNPDYFNFSDDKFNNQYVLEKIIIDLHRGGMHFDPIFDCKSLDEIYEILNSRFKFMSSKYKLLYSVDPLENLAEMHANDTLFGVLGLEQTPELTAIQYLNFQKSLLNGYSICLSPTLIFFENVSKHTGLDLSVLKNFKCYDENKAKMLEMTSENYSLDSRLELGLAISADEYKSLSDNLSEIKYLIKKGDIKQ